MPNNDPFAEYASTDLYQDASGRGAMLNAPIAAASIAAGGTINGAKKKGKKEPIADSVDYLASLFNGEELSEEFKSKAATIFQAAINEKVSIIESHILQAAKELIAEQSQAATEVISEATANTSATLIEHIDGYMEYVIEEWMNDNKVAVERGLRTEIAENFIHGLKDLFENSFIDVPQEKYNILDDIYESNEELQNNCNTLIRENMSLKNEVKAHMCAEAFIRQTSGLADTQVEKLAKLSEGIEFESVEQYAHKVGLLRESYFNRSAHQAPAPAQTQAQYRSNNQFGIVPLNEDSDSSFVNSSGSDPLMENVMNTISLMNRNKSKIEKVFPENTNASRLASLINPNFVKDSNI